MPRVFQIILINAVVDYALHIAFVVPHLQFDFVAVLHTRVAV